MRVDNSFIEFVMPFLIYSGVAYFCHRMVLKGERFDFASTFRGRFENGETAVNWRFTGYYVLFLLFPIVVMGLIVWAIVASVGFEQLDRNQLERIVLTVAVPVLVPYGILLSLLGTILPATAVNDDTSFRAAFERGRHTFFATLGRLTGGSLLYTIAFIFFFGLLSKLLTFPEEGSGILYALISVPINVVALVPILLAATALSMAYETGEQSPPPLPRA